MKWNQRNRENLAFAQSIEVSDIQKPNKKRRRPWRACPKHSLPNFPTTKRIQRALCESFEERNTLLQHRISKQCVKIEHSKQMFPVNKSNKLQLFVTEEVHVKWFRNQNYFEFTTKTWTNVQFLAPRCTWFSQGWGHSKKSRAPKHSVGQDQNSASRTGEAELLSGHWIFFEVYNVSIPTHSKNTCSAFYIYIL